MQINGPERTACLPGPEHGLGGLGNIPLLRACNLTNAAIEALEERSRVRGVDSLVLMCEERGAATLDSLLHPFTEAQGFQTSAKYLPR
jgi:hypothetical protein